MVQPTKSDALSTALTLVRLDPLMARTSGNADVGIGLVDGPVAINQPDLAEARIRRLAADDRPVAESTATRHATFVAGILVARRGSPAPAICPGCTLLSRSIFRADVPPAAPPDDVGRAIVECVDAGARIVNVSAAASEPATRAERGLGEALDHAARRGALVIAAAGNQAALGSSEITRHRGVIPVVAYDLAGRPMIQSNFGESAGRRGLGAPGEGIVSLELGPQAGTSFAAAFVTGAVALLWSLFPKADASALRRALSSGLQRTTVIPPLMDAEAAYRALAVGLPNLTRASGRE